MTWNMEFLTTRPTWFSCLKFTLKLTSIFGGLPYVVLLIHDPPGAFVVFFAQILIFTIGIRWWTE